MGSRNGFDVTTATSPHLTLGSLPHHPPSHLPPTPTLPPPPTVPPPTTHRPPRPTHPPTHPTPPTHRPIWLVGSSQEQRGAGQQLGVRPHTGLQRRGLGPRLGGAALRDRGQGAEGRHGRGWREERVRGGKGGWCGSVGGKVRWLWVRTNGTTLGQVHHPFWFILLGIGMFTGGTSF